MWRSAAIAWGPARSRYQTALNFHFLKFEPRSGSDLFFSTLYPDLNIHDFVQIENTCSKIMWIQMIDWPTLLKQNRKIAKFVLFGIRNEFLFKLLWKFNYSRNTWRRARMGDNGLFSPTSSITWLEVDEISTSSFSSVSGDFFFFSTYAISLCYFLHF